MCVCVCVFCACVFFGQELRFIFPAIPMLNIVAALGLAKLHRRCVSVI